jgi:DNA-binding NarL/FixJ family response regulator
MVAVAIYSADPAFRLRLEQLLRAELCYTVASVTPDPAAVRRLIEHSRVDAVVAHAPSREHLPDWRNRHPATTFVVIAGESDEGETLDALYAGASAILPPWAESTEIAAAIDLARRGLTLLPRDVLDRLLDASSPTAEESLRDDGASGVSLTPREHQVLAAMADGASNKVIARRLGISLHTAKFHVAAILAKLDADSRTEAVARAAHLGLVML